MNIEPEKQPQEQQKTPISNSSWADIMKNRVKASAKNIEKKNINVEIDNLKKDIASLGKRLEKLLADNGHKFVGDFKNDLSVPQKIKDKAEALYREKETKEKIELPWLQAKHKEAKKTLLAANKFLRGA